ncbi:MAG: TrkA family potassium uptake protein [Eubacteriales bacterium]|nr:TrkA family potassium uptake protein [Clostridia bacterium]MDY2846028.1 TrkA family potassium uptake protein [Eubacteriales bacterium]
MKKNQKKNSSELYAVIGLGRFGMALARELAAKGKSLLVIDYDREKINEVLEFTDNAFVINSLTIDALEETGIGEADVAVVCIGEKIDISILATLNLMKLGVKRVISKAMSEEQGEVLKLLGAEVVYPEHDMALRLASKLVSPHILEYISLSSSIDIMEIRMTPIIDGVTVIDSGLRAKFGLNVIALRHGDEMTTDIRPTTKLIKGDTITVIGKKENIAKLEEYLGS